MLTGGPSYWFHAIGGLPRPRPALPGPLDVDVAIVGGGFTGLWTAYYLKRADPSLRVCVLEQEVCGWGAPGATAAGSAARSPASAIRDKAAIDDAVDEIGRVCAAEGVECDFHKGGALHVVTAAAQLPLLRDRPGWLEPAQLTSASASPARSAACSSRSTRACSRPRWRAGWPTSSSGSASASTRRRGSSRSAPAWRARRMATCGRAGSCARPRATRRISAAYRRAAHPAALDDGRHRAAARRRLGADRLAGPRDGPRRGALVRLHPADRRRPDRDRRSRAAVLLPVRATTATARSRTRRSTASPAAARAVAGHARGADRARLVGRVRAPSATGSRRSRPTPRPASRGPAATWATASARPTCRAARSPT